MDYKQELTQAMTAMGRDPRTRFIGYGVSIGKAMGTLKEINDTQLIEMPVAENLMVSFGIGLSLKGLLPVVFIERFDFILNAMDAIVNHLDKIAVASEGEFRPAMILRIVVGNRKKPLFTGATHTQDLSRMLQKAVTFPVIQLHTPAQIKPVYETSFDAMKMGISSALVEFKDQI
jgi:pyruvate/2-oxoglutarate/acetoin dehydrogenase E1 component